MLHSFASQNQYAAHLTEAWLKSAGAIPLTRSYGESGLRRHSGVVRVCCSLQNSTQFMFLHNLWVATLRVVCPMPCDGVLATVLNQNSNMDFCSEIKHIRRNKSDVGCLCGWYSMCIWHWQFVCKEIPRTVRYSVWYDDDTDYREGGIRIAMI